jgi:Fe-S-cluster containining protein
MSYQDLEDIRQKGIDGIVNLCGEFCDLHELEERSGFEVYYLPIPDECAPDMEEMERGLAWLDEAIYLGKKILVHCRHGHGRTGTFVAAYMLRRGLGLKLAEKSLKNTRATPTNYGQWQLLRRFQRQEGTLIAAAPQIANRPEMQLQGHLEEYAALVLLVDAKSGGTDMRRCGREHNLCCRELFDLCLLESIQINDTINRRLASEQRRSIIEKAVAQGKMIRELRRQFPLADTAEIAEKYRNNGGCCPLSRGEKCIIYQHRPLRCRVWGLPGQKLRGFDHGQLLARLSQEVYLELTGNFQPDSELRFSMADTVSGRFVQLYFQAMSEPAG